MKKFTASYLVAMVLAISACAAQPPMPVDNVLGFLEHNYGFSFGVDTDWGLKCYQEAALPTSGSFLNAFCMKYEEKTRLRIFWRSGFLASSGRGFEESVYRTSNPSGAVSSRSEILAEKGRDIVITDAVLVGGKFRAVSFVHFISPKGVSITVVLEGNENGNDDKHNEAWVRDEIRKIANTVTF